MRFYDSSAVVKAPLIKLPGGASKIGGGVLPTGQTQSTRSYATRTDLGSRTNYAQTWGLEHAGKVLGCSSGMKLPGNCSFKSTLK